MCCGVLWSGVNVCVNVWYGPVLCSVWTAPTLMLCTLSTSPSPASNIHQQPSTVNKGEYKMLCWIVIMMISNLLKQKYSCKWLRCVARVFYVYSHVFLVYTREVHVLHTWELSSCVCHLKNHHFDPSLSSEWQVNQKLQLDRF